MQSTRPFLQYTDSFVEGDAGPASNLLACYPNPTEQPGVRAIP